MSNLVLLQMASILFTFQSHSLLRK